MLASPGLSCTKIECVVIGSYLAVRCQFRPVTLMAGLFV
jgi:hypothetical protein